MHTHILRTSDGAPLAPESIRKVGSILGKYCLCTSSPTTDARFFELNLHGLPTNIQGLILEECRALQLLVNVNTTKATNPSFDAP